MHPYLAEDACNRASVRRVRAAGAPHVEWPEDLELDLMEAVAWVGEGERLDIEPLKAARREIEDLLRGPSSVGSDRDRIEGRAAVILYAAIEDSGSDVQALDDPGFWRYVALAHLWNLVAWREPAFRPSSSEEPVSSTRVSKYVDGKNFFNCVPSRMYLRVKCLGGLEFGDLASAVRKGTDFWRSHILRVRAGEYPPIVRAMVRRQAGVDTRLDTDPLREFAKQLNRTLVNLVPAMLDDDAADRLVGELWERHLS